MHSHLRLLTACLYHRQRSIDKYVQDCSQERLCAVSFLFCYTIEITLNVSILKNLTTSCLWIWKLGHKRSSVNCESDSGALLTIWELTVLKGIIWWSGTRHAIGMCFRHSAWWSLKAVLCRPFSRSEQLRADAQRHFVLCKEESREVLVSQNVGGGKLLERSFHFDKARSSS